MTLKIEKGVKIPARQYSGKYGKTRLIIENMKAGDSIFFKDARKAHSFRTMALEYLRETPYKTVSRKISNGFRIWKIKR